MNFIFEKHRGSACISTQTVRFYCLQYSCSGICFDHIKSVSLFTILGNHCPPEAKLETNLRREILSQGGCK